MARCVLKMVRKRSLWFFRRIRFQFSWTCQIELTYNDETPDEGYNIGSGFGHFAFAVDSLDDFTNKIEKLGYEYLYPPFDLNGKGTKIAFINDPDGYEIELIETVVW